MRRQRVAAYAVVVRRGRVLLSRLAPYLSATERWTLPGGGIDFGEHPRDAVVREVAEETGLSCTVGEPLLIDAFHRVVDEESDPTELHSVRLVFEGWVPADAPEPRVVEVDGSTVDARWIPLVDVASGEVATVPMVGLALDAYRPAVRQRLAVKALVVRDGHVLLARNSPRGPRPGTWSLPGGGVEHGEAPYDALVREVAEETGLQVRSARLLRAVDEHFVGVAPDGREEDFHGIDLVYATEIGSQAPRLASGEAEAGTTDEVAWHPVAAVQEGRLPVAPTVLAGLAHDPSA